MKKYRLLFALCLLAAFSTVHASNGFLLSFDVGNTETDDDELKSDTGIRFGAGFKFNEYVAVTLKRADLGEFEAESEFLSLLSDELSAELGFSAEVTDVSVEVTGMELSVVGFIPLNQMFSIYGRFGMFSWDADFNISARAPGVGSANETESEDGSDPIMGVGVEFRPSENIGLNLGFDRYDIEIDGEESEIDFTHLGLVFYF